MSSESRDRGSQMTRGEDEVKGEWQVQACRPPCSQTALFPQSGEICLNQRRSGSSVEGCVQSAARPSSVQSARLRNGCRCLNMSQGGRRDADRAERAPWHGRYCGFGLW